MKKQKKFIATSVVATLIVPTVAVGVPAVDAEEATEQLIVRTTDVAVIEELTKAISDDIQIVDTTDEITVIEVDANKTENVMAQLNEHEEVEYVEPNVVYNIAATNDTYAESQWNLKAINAEQAWADLDQNVTSGDSVVVAVLDTGVQHEHEDLQERILNGATFVNGEEDKNTTGADDQGHGTYVSGFIAANANNELGIAGVTGNQNVKILPVKVMNKNGSGTAADIAKGIEYAISQGVDVINMSLSGEYSETVDEAVQRAAEAGIVVVAAAGNGGGNADVSYPAALPNVISVAALATNDQHYTRSNVGETVDIAAPGAGVLSTSMTTEKYTTGSGTSYATPHVAAVAALYKLKNPTATAAEVEQVLKATAKDVGATGWDSKTGAGKIDAAAALAGQTTINTIGFTLPNANANLLGNVDIQLALTDPTSASKIKLYANEVEIGTIDQLSTSTTFAWDTTKVADGNYTLKAVLVDAFGTEIETVTRTVSVFNEAPSGYMFNVKTPTGTTAKAASVALYEKITAEDGSYTYDEVWTGMTDSEGVVRVPSHVGTDLKTLQVIVQGTFDAPEGNTWFMYNREVSATGTVELASTNTVPVHLKTTDVNEQELVGAEYFISMHDENGVALTAPKQVNKGTAEISPTIYIDKGQYDIHSHFKGTDGTYLLSQPNTNVTANTDITFDANDAGAVEVAATEETKVVNAVLYLYNDNVSDIFGSNEVITGKKFFVTPGEYKYIVEAEVEDLDGGDNWIYVFDHGKNVKSVKKGETTTVRAGGELKLTALESDYASLKRYYKQRGLDYIERDETKNIAHKLDGAFYTTQKFEDNFGNALIGLRRGSIDSSDALYQKNMNTGQTIAFDNGESTVTAIDFGNIYAKYKVVNTTNGKTILDSHAKNPTNPANRGYYWYAFWVTTSSDITPGIHKVSVSLDSTPLAPDGLSEEIDVEMQNSSIDLQVVDSANAAKPAYITIMSATKEEDGDYSWDTLLTKWTDANKTLSIPTNFKTSDHNVAIIRYTTPTGEYGYLFKDFKNIEELNTTVQIPANMQKVAINAYNDDTLLSNVSTKQWLIKHAIEVDGETIYATANNLQNYKKDAIYLAPGTYTFEGNYVGLPDGELKRDNYYFLNPNVTIEANDANEVKFNTKDLAQVNIEADTDSFTDVRGAIVYPYNKYSDSFTSTLRVGHRFYVPANLEMDLQVQLGYGDKESSDVIWNYFLSKGTQKFEANEQDLWKVGGSFKADVSLDATTFTPGTIALNGHAAIQDSYDNIITSVLVNESSDYSISEAVDTVYTLRNGEIIESKINAEGDYVVAHGAPAANAKSFKPVLKVYDAKGTAIYEKADLAYYTEIENIVLNNVSSGSYRVELALAASPQGPIKSDATKGLFTVSATGTTGGSNESGGSTGVPTDNTGSTGTPADNTGDTNQENIDDTTTKVITSDALKENERITFDKNAIQVSIPTKQLAATDHTITIEKIDGQLHFTATADGEEVVFNDFVELTFTASEFTNAEDFAFVRVLEGGTHASIPYTVKDGVVTLKVRKGGTFAVTTEHKVLTDLKNDTHAAYIKELTKRHIIKGKENNEFDPNGTTTRAHFAAIIARALDLSPASQSPFADTQGKWFEDDVQALYEAGIIKGKSANTFDPNSSITRQQAALMMVRLIDYLNIKTTAVVDNAKPFTDLDKVSTEAKDAVLLLQQLGIFSGKNNGVFDPSGKLTRSQMSKIIYKLLQQAELIQ